jgi:hypothetical protein
VIGTIVNALLLAGAFYVRDIKKLLPLVVLPSLGALASGAIFGNLAGIALYFAPVIWLGNAALVAGTKYFKYAFGWGYAKSVSAAIALKVAAIGGAAAILYSLGLVPYQFLYAMSAVQLLTAASAGALFYAAYRARR